MTNIIVSNIARTARRKAREEGITIDVYFAGMLAGLTDDREAFGLSLQAYAQIAIEDQNIVDINRAERIRNRLILIDAAACGSANDGKPANFDVLTAISGAAQEALAELGVRVTPV